MFELTTLVEYTDDALLSEVRRVGAIVGPQRLTQARFLQHSRVHVTTLRNRFGSWHKALELAGIDESVAPRPKTITHIEVVEAIRLFARDNSPGQSPTLQEIAARLGVHRDTLSKKFGAWRTLLKEAGLAPVPLGRRYTDAECFENILGLWTHYGRQPSFAELNQSPSRVGSKAYVRRWGGWRAALGAFISYVNEPTDAAGVAAISASPAAPESEEASVSEPRSISLSLRYKVLCRDRFRCVICGRSPANNLGVELHVDHVVPWSKGGQNKEENLRTLCFDCNLGKGAKLERV